MSNRVALQFTKFSNLDEMGKVLEESFGYRIYDDYGQDYNNTYDSVEELNEHINIKTLQSFISENHEEFFESVRDKGIYFNGGWIPVEDMPEVDY